MAESDSLEGFGWDLMISYCWAQQELVVEIKRKLEERGFKIWIDKEQVVKYKRLPEAMGHGISNSTAILLCISHDYEKSHNCEKEAHFASSEKKPLIFVKLVDDYQPKEPWLKFLMGESLYFVITSEKIIDNFQQLEMAIAWVVSPQKPTNDELIETVPETAKSPFEESSSNFYSHFLSTVFIPNR